MAVRFAHVNLIARDWEALASFYERALGCRRLPPERDHRGEWIEKVTGITGARIRGIHLALPGGDGRGPTLEIFGYERNAPPGDRALNREGLAHLAFAVDDVEAALARVIAEGGARLGAVASQAVPGAGTITIVYARDPEGNIIELQRWA